MTNKAPTSEYNTKPSLAENFLVLTWSHFFSVLIFFPAGAEADISRLTVDRCWLCSFNDLDCRSLNPLPLLHT